MDREKRQNRRDSLEKGTRIHEAIEQMLNAEWTTEWPKEEGWYWTYQEDHRSTSTKQQDVFRPAEVRHAGREPNKFWVYIRDGVMLYPQQLRNRPPIWWLPLQLPLSRPPEGT